MTQYKRVKETTNIGSLNRPSGAADVEHVNNNNFLADSLEPLLTKVSSREEPLASF